MLLNIISFELKYWKKRAITYIFPLLVFMQALVLFTVENVSFGSDVVYRNSPHSLTILYYVTSMVLPLFVNAFIASGVTRDYEFEFHQIIGTLPVSRSKVLIGRFIGGAFVASWMFIGILFADLIAPLMPWANVEQLGPLRLDSHFQNYTMIALPNIFILGSILLVIASFAKNINYSFLGAIVIFVAYQAVNSLNNNIDNKVIASLSDPYGFIPIFYFTKKWSAFEKNTMLFQVDWKFLANRAIWFFVAFLMWIWALKGQKFFAMKPKKAAAKAPEIIKRSLVNPILTKNYSLSYHLRNIHYQARIDLLHILRSPGFIVVLGLIFLVLGMELISMYNNDRTDNLATTYNTISFLEAVSQMIKLAIIYFAGMLVWKERENKVNDILDSLPNKTWVVYLGKVLSVIYLMLIISILLTIIGVLYQAFNGFYVFDWKQYFWEFFVFNIFDALTLVVLSILIQVLCNNRFLGYFISCILLIGEGYLLEWIDISSNLFGITPSLPSVIFSDFYGYGPYLSQKLSFMFYWLAIYGLLALISYWFFIRGHKNHWKERISEMKSRVVSSRKISITIVFLAFCSGGFLYYQTKIVNTYFSKEENLKRSAYYEKTFKKLANHPTPKVVDVNYDINLYPEERRYDVKGSMAMVNTESVPIDRMYVNNDFKHPFVITSKDIKLSDSNKKSTVNFQTYMLEKPLLPGDTIVLNYSFEEKNKGIENSLSNVRLMPNGTFLDYGSFTPSLGYQEDYEINDKSDREKKGLPVKAESMPTLEKNCSEKCKTDYLGVPALWTKIHTKISTSGDQTAIAPGSLIRQWKENERNYFEYNLAQPSKFFFSIVSARFEVKRDTIKGVKCEVYYIPEHKFNVDVMMSSLKKSIAYYSQNFGPYRHNEARIIEFPQFSSFAQAFPGTMPYSESIGFTSNLVKNPKDVNEVFHVVAHEMAHQWWAHQVIGAKMQGATLMSESLAEYSSLKLLEKEYGIDMMAKFLKESNNGYVFSRANESRKESALYQVDNQGYIHYQKGSVVLHSIQKLIGESKMNIALSNLVKKWAYSPPPYPSSYAFLDQIYAQTPASMLETVRDGLERIIIFETDIKDAKTVANSSKKYSTTIDFNLVKKSADPNAKQTKKISEIIIGQSKEAPINDFFDIALYKKKDDKSRYGELIKIERVQLSKKTNKYTIQSDVKPDKIVIDPYFLHIYKDPEENIKSL
jgi:ABC-type transport system involved in multi-copper enzyme maturation permease subunit